MNALPLLPRALAPLAAQPLRAEAEVEIRAGATSFQPNGLTVLPASDGIYLVELEQSPTQRGGLGIKDHMAAIPLKGGSPLFKNTNFGSNHLWSPGG